MSNSQMQELRKRLRWSAESARAVLTEAKESKLPLVEFARQHGLEAGKLYKWRRRLDAMQKNGGRPSFEEFEVRRGSGNDPCGTGLEIMLKNGLAVRVGSRFDAETLRRLLVALCDGEGAC